MHTRHRAGPLQIACCVLYGARVRAPRVLYLYCTAAIAIAIAIADLDRVESKAYSAWGEKSQIEMESIR